MEMITYIQTKGNKPFNWFEVLKREKIDRKKWNNLAKLSVSWVTCAVGNQCSIIPRDDMDGEPMDNKLKVLGFNFHQYIKTENRKGALDILEKIEIRSSEIIQEIIESSCESK